MIDSKFGRKDHRSIPATAIERRLEPLDIRSNQKKRVRVREIMREQNVEVHKIIKL
jgi:hypothetical protein